MTKYIACRSLDSSRRRSRISSIREEYCFYIDDDEYGYYEPDGSKTSMPFGMLVQQILGEQGQIKLRIAKQLLDNVPAIRYTIATFDPNQTNPDTLYQGGSSAADVFPGTNEVFEGEINGYGEISSSGIGISKNYTIYYVYDGINPIIEYSPNGSILKKYVYAGGRHIAKIAGADTHYYHCDALGSPRKVTNENGIVRWQARYYPFGEMFTTMGSGNTHTFTGKEWDSEMNLNYFCQRYYDPEIGRFMTLDSWTNLPDDERLLSHQKYMSWDNYLLEYDQQGTYDISSYYTKYRNQNLAYDTLSSALVLLYPRLGRLIRPRSNARYKIYLLSHRHQLSGYLYCINNPLKYIDPTGQFIDPITWGVAFYAAAYLLDDFERGSPKANYALEYWGKRLGMFMDWFMVSDWYRDNYLYFEDWTPMMP